jgi:hypothetical protein
LVDVFEVNLNEGGKPGEMWNAPGCIVKVSKLIYRKSFLSVQFMVVLPFLVEDNHHGKNGHACQDNH